MQLLRGTKECTHSSRKEVMPVADRKTEDAECRVASKRHESGRHHPLASPSHSALPACSSSKQIRLRLLTQLGFQQPTECFQNKRNRQPNETLGRSRSFDTTINDRSTFDSKYDSSLTVASSSSSHGSADSSSREQSINRCRRSVSFDDTVHVTLIPSRRDYSERVRRYLWPDPIELKENASRNCYEFASEGWDWQKVVDDSEMYNIEGEKIHPIHLRSMSRSTSLQDGFLATFSFLIQRQQHPAAR